MNIKHCFIFYPTKIGASEHPIRDYISTLGQITFEDANRIECVAATQLHTLGKAISSICKGNHLVGIVVDYPKPWFASNCEECARQVNELQKKDKIPLDDLIGHFVECLRDRLRFF